MSQQLKTDPRLIKTEMFRSLERLKLLRAQVEKLDPQSCLPGDGAPGAGRILWNDLMRASTLLSQACNELPSLFDMDRLLNVVREEKREKLLQKHEAFLNSEKAEHQMSRSDREEWAEIRKQLEELTN